MSKSRVKTIDGERTRVDELNLGDLHTDEADVSVLGRIKRAYRNASLLMAGMYTGLNCYGTPHSERDVEDVEDVENRETDKPDNRLI